MKHTGRSRKFDCFAEKMEIGKKPSRPSDRQRLYSKITASMRSFDHGREFITLGTDSMNAIFTAVICQDPNGSSVQVGLTAGSGSIQVDGATRIFLDMESVKTARDQTEDRFTTEFDLLSQLRCIFSHFSLFFSTSSFEETSTCWTDARNSLHPWRLPMLPRGAKRSQTLRKHSIPDDQGSPFSSPSKKRCGPRHDNPTPTQVLAMSSARSCCCLPSQTNSWFLMTRCWTRHLGRLRASSGTPSGKPTEPLQPD